MHEGGRQMICINLESRKIRRASGKKEEPLLEQIGKQGRFLELKLKKGSKLNNLYLLYKQLL